MVSIVLEKLARSCVVALVTCDVSVMTAFNRNWLDVAVLQQSAMHKLTYIPARIVTAGLLRHRHAIGTHWCQLVNSTYHMVCSMENLDYKNQRAMVPVQLMMRCMPVSCRGIMRCGFQVSLEP